MMKTMRNVLCAVGVLLLCSSMALADHTPGSPPALGPELIINGDFEGANRVADWNAVAKGSNDPAGAPIFDGPGNPGYAGGGGSFNGADYFIFQEVTTTPGAEYQLTFDLNRMAGVTNISGVAITGPTGDLESPSTAWSLLSPPANFDGPLQDGGGTVRIITPTSWASYSMNLTAHKTSLKIRSNGTWSSNNMIDNVSFKQIVPESTSVMGDFNGNNTVDAADYTIWQDNLDLDASLLSGNGSGAATVVQADYLLWKTNFGQSAASGSADPIPEPTTLLLPLLALAAVPLRVRCG